MIFVDSSVWIDYFRGLGTPMTERLDALLGARELVVGDLVLTEVLQGFVIEKEFLNALELMSSLQIVRLGGYQLSVQAARNFRVLRRHGFTIRKTIDSLIATRCIEDNLQLLHNDRDFLPFQKHLGLKCVLTTDN